MDEQEGEKCDLTLGRVLLGCGKSHIGLIDTSSFLREDFTTHGLHLNSQRKRRLSFLTAKRLGDDNVPGISSIPIISNARASPFLA